MIVGLGKTWCLVQDMFSWHQSSAAFNWIQSSYLGLVGCHWGRPSISTFEPCELQNVGDSVELRGSVAIIVIILGVGDPIPGVDVGTPCLTGREATLQAQVHPIWTMGSFSEAAKLLETMAESVATFTAPETIPNFYGHALASRSTPAVNLFPLAEDHGNHGPVQGLTHDTWQCCIANCTITRGQILQIIQDNKVDWSYPIQIQ